MGSDGPEDAVEPDLRRFAPERSVFPFCARLANTGSACASSAQSEQNVPGSHGTPLAASLHNQNIMYVSTRRLPCTCTTRFHTLDGDRLQVVITNVTTDLPGLSSLDLENVTKARCH